MFQYLTSEYQNKYSFENWLDRVDKYKSDPYSPIEIKKFADKLKDMVCVLVVQEKVGRQEFKNTPLENIGENGITQLKVKFFVNNPTGRNKLVFSSEEPVYYISELINTGCYKSAYTIQSEILTPRLLMQCRNRLWKRYHTLTSGLMLLWKSMYLSNWVLTDTRFPNEGMEYIKEKRPWHKDHRQISKTEQSA
jgi:hypothetical protein